MIPEQEAELFTTIGGIKANIENYHDDTKKALDLITGNGKPQEGILYIMTEIRKNQLNCPVLKGETEIRLQKLETGAAVAEVKKTMIDKLWGWCKTHPKTAIFGGLAILNALGFSTAGILNFLHKINIIAIEAEKILPK